MRKAVSRFLILVAAAFCAGGCGIYSFSGTSIQSDVHTIHIELFEYKAQKVNPTLSSDLTESLRTQFRKMTSLEQVDTDPDLEITGEITGYSVNAAAISTEEVATQSRLTVTVRVSFTNRKYPEDDFSDKSISHYADFDSNLSLEAVEGQLCEEIVKKLTEDIFNATVAQW